MNVSLHVLCRGESIRWACKYIVLLRVFALLAFLSTSDTEIKIYAYAGIGEKEKEKHTYEGCKKRKQG